MTDSGLGRYRKRGGRETDWETGGDRGRERRETDRGYETDKEVTEEGSLTEIEEGKGGGGAGEGKTARVSVRNRRMEEKERGRQRKGDGQRV